MAHDRRIVTALYVEKDRAVVDEIGAALKDAKCFDFRLAWLGSLIEAKAFLKVNTVDVVLLGLHLPNGQGLDVARTVKEQAGDAPLVIVTQVDDDDMAVEALTGMADEYLIKGKHDVKQIVERVRNVVVRAAARKEFAPVRATVEKLEGIVKQCRSDPNLPPYDTVINADETIIKTEPPK